MKQPGGEVVSDEPVSIWASKPWWCQPWTIVLSGLVAVACSWVLLHRWWISVPVSLAVLAWWGLFLGLVPAAYRQQQSGDIDVNR